MRTYGPDMDFTFTPGRSPETLQLSPTHLHDVNPLLELRNLRRSMSRSPSKFVRSSPATPKSPLRHSAASPVGTLPFQDVHDENAIQSVRRPRSTRPALTRATPIRGLFKTAQAQAQAHLAQQQQATTGRRALQESSDSGNSSPQSSQDFTAGNDKQSSTPDGTPADTFENALHHARTRTIPIRTPSTRARTAAAVEKESREWTPAKSSPLKRSDGALTSRSATIDSPSAKRRSLNGAFDDTRNSDLETFSAADENISPEEAAFRATLPPSAFGGYRRTLFQNKMSKTPSSRNRRSLESSTPSGTPKRTSARPRPRTSMDSALSARDSIRDFTERTDRQVLDGACQTIDFEPPSHNTRSRERLPHPLSHAVSPNSPMAGASTNTGFEPSTSAGASGDFERPSIFSKSLPAGALRPQEFKFVQGAENNSFATPKPFDVARPDPTAFMSTGLISKKHRNPDDLPPPPNGRAGMPDTPCKKTNVGFAVPSSPGSVVSVAKPRFGQPSFGTPSRPFNASSARPAPSAFSKSLGFFGKNDATGRFDRRASFTSIDGDECVPSPTHDQQAILPDSQSSADELPPTPTKQHTSFMASKSSSLRSSLFGRRPHVAVNTFATPEASREPSVARHSNGSDRIPQTPIADGGVPDPSYLSISPNNKTPLSPRFRGSLGATARTPATPSHRDSINGGIMTGNMATPSHYGQAQDADPVLSMRFKRVEWFARGEFSDVYKVYQQGGRSGYFSPSNASKSQSTPVPDRVYMVKKSKVPYHSSKLRKKKLREPNIMQALGKSDHTVFLMDYWEANHHLYMQTEFCEEGTLSDFLLRQGREGRLDDFRIWKVMLELALGIKHIHDSGFIHLDLKPENVFIDFEGTLKIGDFGLASEWPAPADIEGEGDRRYIGPDLLHGSFDKPADIFALGMIMYEIAANFIPPDNGGWWQKLRSGDFTGLPSLTSNSTDSIDAEDDSFLNPNSGLGLAEARSTESLFSPSESAFVSHASIDTRMTSWEGSMPEKLPSHDTELAQPPAFMLDPNHVESLDNVVHWMMLPEASERPVIDQILNVAGCQWVGGRRRSGAVIYEGRWGPADHMLSAPSAEPEDSIMTDV